MKEKDNSTGRAPRRWWAGLRWPHGAVLMPTLIATSIFKLVLLLPSVTDVVTRPWDAVRVVGFGVLVVTVAFQLTVTVAVLQGRHRSIRPRVLACVELAVSLPPLFLFGRSWAATPILGLSDVLVCTVGAARVLIVVVGLVAFVAGSARYYADVALVVQLGESGLAIMLFFSALRMAVFIRDLEAARTELARLAVADERLRVSRDLHDTIGQTLSVGLLKLELARRAPELAEQELGEVSALLREAMTSMQKVVADMRGAGLRREILGACSVLRSAGIATTATVGDVELGAEAEQVFGWVVREGATNVLRHSAATRCEITVQRRVDLVELAMRNDAPTLQDRGKWAPSGHNGLVGMRQRLANVGGRLSVRTDDDSYLLVASVPTKGGS